MLYRKTGNSSLSVMLQAVLLSCLASCGGGIERSASLFTSASVQSNIDVSQSGTTGNSELQGQLPRRDLSIGYDSSGFEEVAGLRLVPLDAESQPQRAAIDDYSLQLKAAPQQDGSRIASIEVSGVEKPHMHLHYDAKTLSVRGVGVKNPYGTGQEFLSIAYIPQPGVLEIKVLPQGGAPGWLASGSLAEVHLIPSELARSSSAQPTGIDHYGAAYFVEGPSPASPESSGTLTVRLDGTLGDLATKDHVLSGAELTTPVNDNIVQDVLVDNIGASYNSEDGFSEDLDIVFTERLVGDHDNNGIVNINDITPVATLAMDHSYDPPIEWEFDDPFHVQSASYESGYATSLWNKMLGNVTGWFGFNHDIDVFYLADSSSEPTGYDWDFSSYGGTPAHGLTDAMNGADSLWDANVKSYNNWDSDNNGSLESDYWFFDGNGDVEWGVPGDLLPMAYHMGEYISGIDVWTVQHSQGGFTPTASLASIPSTAKKVTALSKDRGSYADDPFNLSGVLEKYRKAEFRHTLLATDFSFSDPSSMYDIVICPYGVVNSVKQYGPVTRVQNIVQYTLPPGDENDYGPQYNGDNSISPLGNSVPYKGIGSVLQKDQREFLLKCVDADDLDENGNWGDETVQYKVYAYANDTYDGTDGSTVFDEGHIVLVVSEDNSDLVEKVTERSVDYIKIKVELECGEFGLPMDQEGKKIWFGVRAAENNSSPANPEGKISTGIVTGYPNEEVASVEIADMMEPYFVRVGGDNGYFQQSCPDEFVESTMYFSSSTPFGDSIPVLFNPAIDPPLYDPSRPLKYKLYASENPFTDVEEGVELGSKILTVSDYIDENGNLKVGPGTQFSDDFQFVITQIPDGDGLSNVSTDDFTHVIVTACELDASEENEILCSSDHESTQVNSRRNLNNSLILQTGLGLQQASVRGSIAAFGDDIHILYPSETVLENFTDLDYERLPDGDRDTNHRLEEIIDDAGFSYFPGLTITSTSLDFQVNNGASYELYSDLPAPVIAYSGSDGTWAERWVITAIKAGSDFNFTRHTQPVPGNLSVQGGTSILSYRFKEYFDDGGPVPSTPFSGASYLLCWGYEDSSFLTGGWSESSPMGQIRAKTQWEPLYRNQMMSIVREDLSFWTGTTDSGATDVLESTGYCNWLPTYKQTDIVMRDMGFIDNQFDLSSSGLDYIQNKVFCLSSSPHFSGDSTITSPDKFESVDLNWTNNPNYGSWSSIDLMSTFSNAGMEYDSGNDSIPFGPNSMDIIRPDDENEGSFVYVTYVNATYGERSGSDGTGLRIARGIESGGVISNWSSPANEGVIDDEYFLRDLSRETGTWSNAGVLELKRKPDIHTDDGAFEGLGCVYISPSLSIYLTESQGSSTTWQRFDVDDEYADDPIDEGQVLWVKLAYLDSSTPYVLYAIKTTQFGDYEIRLFAPGII